MTAVATPASAHGQLALSTPAAGSTVNEPMESLALYFTEQPTPNAYFTVSTPSGKRVDRHWSPGEPKRLDKPVQEYHLVDGTWEPRLYHLGYPAKVPVAYWPEQGVYVARYQTIASDGEPVRGEVRFTYKGKMSAPPKGWHAPTDKPDPALAADHAAGPVTAQPSPGSTPGATGPQVAGPTAAPLPGATTTAPNGTGTVPETGSGTVPETGGGTVPETGGSGGAGQSPPGTAAPAGSESGVLVWVVPAVLVAGVGFMVIRAARRPPATDAPGSKPAAARPGKPSGRSGNPSARAGKPPAKAAPRKEPRPKPAKRR